MRTFLTSKLQLIQTTPNPCLMFADALSTALLGVYVEDIILAVARGMVNSSDAIVSPFPSRESKLPPLKFAGSHIELIADGFRVHQENYTATLYPLGAVASLECFRSLCRQLSALGNSSWYPRSRQYTLAGDCCFFLCHVYPDDRFQPTKRN